MPAFWRDPASPTDARATALHPDARELNTLAPLQIEALAKAVIRPGSRVFLLNADNTADAWVSLDTAVSSGRAFVIEVDVDVLAVDADSAESGAAAERLAQEMQRAELAPVVMASGRPGHRHVICRILDPDLRQLFADRARAASLDVRKAIRPPGAPHRLGLPVALLEPRAPQDAVAALAPRDRDSASGSAPGAISKEMRQLLLHGDIEQRRESRSEVVQSLALAFVDAGLDCDDLLRALLDGRNAGGDKVRELAAKRGLGHARRYVRGSWKKAADFARRRPAIRDREDAIVALARIDAAIESSPWPGRSGAVDWSVVRAHLRVARRLHDLAPDVSDRELAELAGVHYQTVARSHRRLQHAGWLRRLRRHHDANAARWQLRLPRTRRDTSVPHGLIPPEGDRCGAEVSHPDGDPAHDVWRYGGGLGKIRCRVWGFLHQPRTTWEVAAWLGRVKRSAERHLSKLRAAGLAVQDPSGTWHRGEADADAVAKRLGVAGEAQRQRWRHEDDRETHRKGLEVWHRERGRAYEWPRRHP